MRQPTVVVVGGGVMGLATGCALAARGAAVTVLERYTVAHERASSHGLTRAIRHAYGAAEIYTRMAARSLDLWQTLARETGRELYRETGVLTLGQADDGDTLPGYAVMREQGLPVELLTPAACERRFPQFSAAAFDAITYNATGGMLFASECLAALAQRLQSLGGTLRENVQVTGLTTTATSVTVSGADGATQVADRAIITAGPWIHDVLPDLHLPVRPTRQQVSYFTGLAAEEFGVGNFPIFLALHAPDMHYYGFPLHGPGWFKAGSHAFGATVDPNVPYAADMAEHEKVRAFFRQVIPAAADAELAAIDRCMYDVTPDEDFILDFHPHSDRIIIGSGFSGHGLKFGVLIGELLAALALEQQPEFPLDRFKLSRFPALG